MGGIIIRRPFPCVSYEATKRVSRWGRPGCLDRGQSSLKRPGWALNAATILKPLVANRVIPTQTFLHMVQHFADSVGPFPRSQPKHEIQQNGLGE